MARSYVVRNLYRGEDPEKILQATVDNLHASLLDVAIHEYMNSHPDGIAEFITYDDLAFRTGLNVERVRLRLYYVERNFVGFHLRNICPKE